MTVNLSEHLAFASRRAAMGDYEACGRIAQLVDLVVARDEELAKLPPPPVDPIVAANALDVAAQPASEGGANA